MTVIIFALVLMWQTYVIYIAAMHLKRYEALIEQKPRPIRWFGLSVLAVGVACDVVLNVVVASVAFLDPPRELLLTRRLQRYVDKPALAWRRGLARWVCHNMLDPFDPKGRHC